MKIIKEQKSCIECLELKSNCVEISTPALCSDVEYDIHLLYICSGCVTKASEMNGNIVISLEWLEGKIAELGDRITRWIAVIDTSESKTIQQEVAVEVTNFMQSLLGGDDEN